MGNQDTICAISTAPGVGGIAVARISGPQAIEIVNRIWKGRNLAEAATHTATFGRIVDPEHSDETLDEAVATIFRAPQSFTGDETVELSIHGSIWIQRELINLLVRQGCRVAEPGEYTRRAFAAGKMDLAEAEAIADVIASSSRAAHRVAMSQMRGNFSKQLSLLRDKLLELASLLELELDFSEEDVEFADRQRLLELSQTTLETVDSLTRSFATGDAIRRGIPVAIIGEPNVGKSSTLNLLLGDNRAIVSDIPGTTRDTIEETIDIDGLTFRFIDTAGLRDTTDKIENLGIDRAWKKITLARIIIWITTPDSDPAALTAFNTQLQSRKHPDTKIILLLNKTDLATPLTIQQHLSTLAHSTSSDIQLPLSATHANGLADLQTALVQLARADMPEGSDSPDAVIVTNARHYQSLLAASLSLSRVISGLQTAIPGDLIAQDVRETIHHLSSITGAITTPDILSSIFSRFCIGK